MAHAAAEVAADHLGNAQSVVAHSHHTREVIVHRADEDAAERDPQERDGPEARPEHGAEDRTRAGDVQELDQKDPPPRQGHVIHAVEETPARGRRPGIGPGLPLEITAIGEISCHQKQQTREKGNHRRSIVWMRI